MIHVLLGQTVYFQARTVSFREGISLVNVNVPLKDVACLFFSPTLNAVIFVVHFWIIVELFLVDF